jgi:cell fate (sporulation/competence/biofilm development) regulator YlbF (YheA/YmcA/DUF963 family)
MNSSNSTKKREKKIDDFLKSGSMEELSAKLKEKTQEVAAKMSTAEKVATLFEAAQTVGVSINDLTVGVYSYVEFAYANKKLNKKQVEAFMEQIDVFQKELIKVINK